MIWLPEPQVPHWITLRDAHNPRQPAGAKIRPGLCRRGNGCVPGKGFLQRLWSTTVEQRRHLTKRVVRPSPRLRRARRYPAWVPFTDPTNNAPTATTARCTKIFEVRDLQRQQPQRQRRGSRPDPGTRPTRILLERGRPPSFLRLVKTKAPRDTHFGPSRIQADDREPERQLSSRPTQPTRPVGQGTSPNTNTNSVEQGFVIDGTNKVPWLSGHRGWRAAQGQTHQDLPHRRRNTALMCPGRWYDKWSPPRGARLITLSHP